MDAIDPKVRPGVKSTGFWLLVLIAALFFLPGISSLPPTDRDEARYIQATRQMLESGNYVDIRFQQEPRYKKPIGIYWLQAASSALVSADDPQAVWPYRIPSFLGALAGVLGLYLFTRKYFGQQTGFWAALLLVSCLILVVEAHLAKTDAALFGAVTGMQCALGDLYLTGRTGLKAWRFSPLWFWLCMAAAILLKGPIPLIMAAGTLLMLALWKRHEGGTGLLRQIRPLWGLPLVLLIVLPWFVAIYFASDGLFFSKAIGEDLLPKLVSGHESHGAPPGYYLLLATLLFWPGSLVTLTRLKTLLLRMATGRNTFLLAWLLPAWLLFELIPTKLPHYILPLLPALAVLTADALLAEEVPGSVRFSSKPARFLLRGAQGLLGAVWLLVTLVLGLAPGILQWQLTGQVGLAGVAAAAAGFLVLYGASRYLRYRQPKNLGLMLIGSCVVFGVVLMWFLPRLELPWVAVRVRQEMDLHGPGKLVSVGYNEPSLVFLAGTATRLVSVEQACDNLTGDYRYLLLDSRSRDKFLELSGQSCTTMTSLAEFPGYNYSKGKKATYFLYERGQELEN
jgi:4-amino-4-deoxy-L-arabinose transferase-like glycosyltransferase